MVSLPEPYTLAPETPCELLFEGCELCDVELERSLSDELVALLPEFWPEVLLFVSEPLVDEGAEPEVLLLDGCSAALELLELAALGELGAEVSRPEVLCEPDELELVSVEPLMLPEPVDPLERSRLPLELELVDLLGAPTLVSEVLIEVLLL